MHHVDLLAAAAGVSVTVATMVLGAWLDLRPGKGKDEPRGNMRDDR
jgi:hypothetical protein